jgi:hypothetical protein
MIGGVAFVWLVGAALLGLLSAVGQTPYKGLGNLLMSFALFGFTPLGLLLPVAALVERRPVPRLFVAGAGPAMLVAAAAMFEVAVYLTSVSDHEPYRGGGGSCLCLPAAAAVAIVPILMSLRLRDDIRRFRDEARVQPFVARVGERASLPLAEAAEALGLGVGDAEAWLGGYRTPTGLRFVVDRARGMVHTPSALGAMAELLSALLHARGAVEVRPFADEVGVSVEVVRHIAALVKPAPGRLAWDEGWIYASRAGGLATKPTKCGACGAAFDRVVHRPTACPACGTIADAGA